MRKESGGEIPFDGRGDYDKQYLLRPLPREKEAKYRTENNFKASLALLCPDKTLADTFFSFRFRTEKDGKGDCFAKIEKSV